MKHWLEYVIEKIRDPRAVKGLVIYFLIACTGFSTNVGSRIIYSELFGIRFSLSVTLAYATGMVVGFVLTKMFAFGARNSGNTYREMVKFAMVSAVALLVTLAFSLVFLALFNWYFEYDPVNHEFISTNIMKLGIPVINRELASHLGGTGFGFFANFFGHKFFTFKSTGYYDKIKTGRKIKKSKVNP
jgi:putative flippase GtrA